MNNPDIETVAYAIQELKAQGLEPSFTAAMALCLYGIDPKTQKVNLSRIKDKIQHQVNHI